MNRENTQCTRTRLGGFTLLELVIVLTIAAVLVTWGFPSLIQSIQNNAVASQNMSLIAMVNLTKSEAIRRNTNVSMVLESTDDGWTAIIEDPNNEADIEGCAEGQLRCSSNERATIEICVGDDPCVTSADLVFNNRGYIDPGDPVQWEATRIFLQHENCSGQSQRTSIDILPSGQFSSCSLPCDSKDQCP